MVPAGVVGRRQLPVKLPLHHQRVCLLQRQRRRGDGDDHDAGIQVVDGHLCRPWRR